MLVKIVILQKLYKGLILCPHSMLAIREIDPKCLFLTESFYLSQTLSLYIYIYIYISQIGRLELRVTGRLPFH